MVIRTPGSVRCCSCIFRGRCERRWPRYSLRCVALRELEFDLVLRGGFHSAKPLESDITQQQELIRWCEHLVVVSPNWWWSAPALLKGYIDRVFLPGFAMRYHRRFPHVHPLLTGRSARVLYMQNFRGDLFWRWISGAALKHCGFRPVRRLALYGAKDAVDQNAASIELAQICRHPRRSDTNLRKLRCW